ncbi:helix-turn-helix domain-containing protein [Streptomyces sp. NPDC021098]
MSPAERERAVMRLSRYGLPAEVIAARVGCAERTVWRIYSRTSAPGVPRVEMAA